MLTEQMGIPSLENDARAKLRKGIERFSRDAGKFHDIEGDVAFASRQAYWQARLANRTDKETEVAMTEATLDQEAKERVECAAVQQFTKNIRHALWADVVAMVMPAFLVSAFGFLVVKVSDRNLSRGRYRFSVSVDDTTEIRAETARENTFSARASNKSALLISAFGLIAISLFSWGHRRRQNQVLKSVEDMATNPTIADGGNASVARASSNNLDSTPSPESLTDRGG